MLQRFLNKQKPRYNLI